MLLEDISIVVFRVDNDVFEQLGEISQFTSLIWPDVNVGYASFELWAPINDENRELIKENNIIWTGGKNAAVVEIIKSVIDKDGQKTYNVKGRTLEKYCTDRIVWGTFVGKGYASTIMYGLVDKNCINPNNKDRKIPWLVNAEDKHVGLNIAQYQKTGGEVYDALFNIATDSDIGFSILFYPREKQLVFEVRAGVDRTYNNTEGNNPVVFSTDLEDLLSSVYYLNNQDLKTVALVQGEDTGENRKSVKVGIVDGKGFNRKELYVDARDLQSEVYNDDGTSTELTPEQYADTLIQRGNEKLAEYYTVETYEAQIRQFGDIQYIYGEDYFKGDMVTVVDEQLGISVSARITSVEENFSSKEYSLVLTFGYSYLTVLQKVKRTL